MLLESAAKDAAIRFQETQAYLSSIKAQEPAFGLPTPLEFNTQKGLAIVLIYSAFEYSVTRLFADSTSVITGKNVQHCHLAEGLYSISLDPELTSVRMAGNANKWHRRSDLFSKQASEAPVSLNASCFLDSLSNTWAKTVQQVFFLLGVQSPAFYDVRVCQYIDTVVDRRNAVAHGRESATQVGRGYTSGDLQTFLDQLSKQFQYMNIVLTSHLESKSFVKVSHRSKY